MDLFTCFLFLIVLSLIFGGAGGVLTWVGLCALLILVVLAVNGGGVIVVG
ncbi:MAG: hypothetical protein Dasosvirus9_4 [Dasosvirus sp.]|uniref:Uncharacterized protein n=1 Tax=Dasosvirus sp. TaxID=2487764 RepID=A0A3G4ZRQ6_9VIRU|nr:MAG: hypothetical protein Dasosvirus9_4 [Dasosvirus sp.]